MTSFHRTKDFLSENIRSSVRLVQRLELMSPKWYVLSLPTLFIHRRYEERDKELLTNRPWEEVSLKYNLW